MIFLGHLGGLTMKCHSRSKGDLSPPDIADGSKLSVLDPDLNGNCRPALHNIDAPQRPWLKLLPDVKFLELKLHLLEFLPLFS